MEGEVWGFVGPMFPLPLVLLPSHLGVACWHLPLLSGRYPHLAGQVGS